MQVRTRFAPSPTGYLPWAACARRFIPICFARRNGGKFILRIEDTDQEREVPGAVEKIYASLAAAGLSYDEGPDVGGEYGPYIRDAAARPLPALRAGTGQARRRLLLLLHQGAAGRGARAGGEGGKTFKYDKHCLHLSPEEVKRRIEAGEPYVIRQNVPTEGKAGFDDLLYGHVEVDCSTLDDNVLIKADGLPTYNFANVVDDHLMAITHVMRGTEYLSSAPKYNLLYEAFGWTPPTYIHLPVVMRDATRKLSKRYGDPRLRTCWTWAICATPSSTSSPCSVGARAASASSSRSRSWRKCSSTVEGLNKSPSIFDMDKLTWFNARIHAQAVLRGVLRTGQAVDGEGARTPRASTLGVLAELLQARTEVLNRIPCMIGFLAENAGV